jgi:hypothetical protein
VREGKQREGDAGGEKERMNRRRGTNETRGKTKGKRASERKLDEERVRQNDGEREARMLWGYAGRRI